MASNGVGDLTVVESTAKSRYHGLSFGLRQMVRDDFQFQMNYTLSWDKSDDDNERDPFTFRYVDPTRLDREWGYSDRDQRHRFNLWTLIQISRRYIPQQSHKLLFGTTHLRILQGPTHDQSVGRNL